MTSWRVVAGGLRLVRASAGALMAAPLALATPTARAQNLVVESTLSTSVTATHRSGSGGEGATGNANDEVVMQVSPGVVATARGGSLQGSLSYSANALLYANESTNNRLTHNLASSGRYSLLSGRGGVDVSASASEQLISAYGAQGSGETGGRENRAQTFSYSVAPFLAGQFFGQTSYQMRLGYSASRAGSTSLGSSESFDGSAALSGRIGRVGWGLNATRNVSDTQQQNRIHSGRVYASASYSPDVEVQLTVRFGRDYQDVTSGESQSTSTWGVGASWIPGPRTSVSLDYDHRYFGASYSVALSHRMASTIWTYTDSRSVQTTPFASRFQVSAYDLFYAQFASIEPDPLKREQLVRAFLTARGIDPNGRVVLSGFLTSLASVQRRQQFTAAYQGLRYTALASLSNGNSRSIVDGATGTDDLASGEAVRQRGLSLTLSYRIDAVSSVVVSASAQRTLATATQAGNDSRSLSGTWSTQLNSRAGITCGVRYSTFDGGTSPYNESSIFGTLGLRF